MKTRSWITTGDCTLLLLGHAKTDKRQNMRRPLCAFVRYSILFEKNMAVFSPIEKIVPSFAAVITNPRPKSNKAETHNYLFVLP